MTVDRSDERTVPNGSTLISVHPWIYAVYRHFNWMAQHGVDGAFLQRFAGQCDRRGDNDGIRRIRDEVGDRVREAAEKNNRVYAIMYVSPPTFPNYPRGLILCEVRCVWSATRKDRGDYQIRLETPRIRQTHLRQSELSKREGKARCRVVGYNSFFLSLSSTA